MIRTIYIPNKYIQVIDLRNLCKRKKQLEAIDVSLCPPSTAIVNDQDGKELAREDIASGATGIIEVNVGAQEYSVIIDFDQSNSLLEYTIIAGSDQAADYINEVLTNVATVNYNLNGTNVNLPFTLESGDNLTVTITRTNASLDSTVKISNV